MKIWHDNSGEGDMASWYLKHVIVHDLQTRGKFYFICDQWMAVEKEDGKLERELFVAKQKQKTELKFLLKKQSKYQIKDSHLCMSLFHHSVQSPFTRLDRVTCGFVFLYNSMLLNILYYDKSFSNQSIQIDFLIFTLTYEQVIECKKS